jgi:2-iminobutanoate/2-iminopropanoate deaminase
MTIKIAVPILLLALFSVSWASKRTHYSSGQTIGPYSPAVEAGGHLYISGQIALKPGTTELANADLETEVRQVMENLIALLKRAGYGISDLVQCTVYLKDMNDFSTFNRIYGSYFEKMSPPARTTVEVSNLPRNARIEISAVAYK